MGFDYQKFIEEEDAKAGRKKKGKSKGPFLALLMLLVALALAGLFGAIYFGYLDLTNIPFLEEYLNPDASQESEAEVGVVEEPQSDVVAVGPEGDIFEGDVPLEFVALSYLGTGKVMISVESPSKVPMGVYPAMLGAENGDVFEYSCEVLAQYPNRLYCIGDPIRAELNVDMLVMQREDVVGNVNVLQQAGLLPQLNSVVWATGGRANALAGPLQAGLSSVKGCTDSYEVLSEYEVQNQWDAWNAIAYLESAGLQLGVAMTEPCQNARPELNLLDTPAGNALNGCLGNLLVGTPCEGLNVVTTSSQDNVLKDFSVVFDCLNNPATCNTLSVPPTFEEGVEPVLEIESGLLAQAQTCATDLTWETPIETAADVLAVQERVLNLSSGEEPVTSSCQEFVDTLAVRERTVDAFAQVQACVHAPQADECNAEFWPDEEHNMMVTLYQELSQRCAEDLQWTGALATDRDYAELIAYVSAVIPWVGQDQAPDTCIALVNFTKDFGYRESYASLLADALKGRLRSPSFSAQAWSKAFSFKIPIPTCPEGQYYEAESGLCRVEK